MAKRYRYAFTRKKEAAGGKWSVAMAVISVLLLPASVFYAFLNGGDKPYITGGLCLLAALLSVYGFFLGLGSFKEKNTGHLASIVGSLANGVISIVWLGIYLSGV
ncbi:MAG: hypothetical protein IKE03_06480 [Blautia sp.]|nr:hypothetical protein [Blautia sp.]